MLSWRELKMKSYKYLLFFIFSLIASLLAGNKAFAFTCKDYRGQILNSGNNGTLNVYVDLQPQIGLNENLVVNLANSISCKNDGAGERNDEVSMLSGSAFGGALLNFTGSVKYYGSSYPFPLNSPTSSHNFTSGSYTPWDTQLYLTPISTAGGTLINQGEKVASVIMYQRGSNISDGGQVATATFTWNLLANNSVIIPTGGCDVSSRNITVSLPDYPGNVSIPATIRCAKNQSISFFLSGNTVDSGNSVFSNTSSFSPAQGVGIQLLRNGTIVPANTNISLGTVGTSPVDLGLSATYARTGGHVAAGNVQSIIGVTFVYL